MFELKPVGYVRSEIKERGERRYARACIEIADEYRGCMKGLEECSHAIVVAFLDRARRDELTVDLPFYKGGIFSVRSPDRPNPVGITVARIERIEGRNMFLERLDFMDGTPVVDIKPYTMSDCVPGYDNAIERRMLLKREGGIDNLFLLASGFHGERCAGLATGVRVVYEALKTKGTLRFDTVSSPRGCPADAFQALCGCTAGNGKLRLWDTGYYRVSDLKIKLRREPVSVEEALYGDILVSP